MTAAEAIARSIASGGEVVECRATIENIGDLYAACDDHEQCDTTDPAETHVVYDGSDDEGRPWRVYVVRRTGTSWPP